MQRRAPHCLVIALVVIAAVGLVASVTAAWAHRYPLDSERFAAATATVLEDPEVVDAVAAAATDQAFDLVLAVADPRDLLPGPLSNLGSGAERWVREQIADQMAWVVQTGPVQELLVDAVRISHGEVVTLVRDGRSATGMLTTDGRVVRLDLTGVVAAGLDVLVDRGLAPGMLGGLHEALRGGLDNTREWLAADTGVDLGEHIGTIVVYDVSVVDEGGLALRSARAMTGMGDAPVVAWVAMAVLATAGGLWLSSDRRMFLGQLGLASAIVAAVNWIYWQRVAGDIEALIADPGARRAAAAIGAELMGPFTVATVVLIGLGAVAGIGARLVGRT